ncbi:MAG: NUDIX domain-containing protein [Cryomorphaceae bacterium]|nr:NUDIX domain-containing protein [Cryomorphaceae bacterium]
MYKVYINHTELRLTEKKNADANQRFYFHEDFDWISLYHQLKNTDRYICCEVIHDNVTDLFSSFSKAFTPIEAAGGVVKNNKGELLMIHRLGKWDLPKGKIEMGESPINAAVREVEEECGIENLTVKDTMPFKTYHTYELDENRILKLTYWFTMKTSSYSKMKPQTEEGIDKVVWVADAEDLRKKLKNTYQNIRDVVISLGFK